MSFHALPSATVRHIGSGQVLVDPCSAVKELVDNALDARASAVSVELAENTLDVVQVRDNGTGVAAADRRMLGQRHCTSKLRDLGELRALGGKSLGFRGEALASLAEVAGALVVLTRVEGEPVAVRLEVRRAGGIERQQPASHPVGTTVRATGLFTGMPVRRQAALKHAAKYLAKVRRTLQAYAFARPGVRFSLRVVNARSGKGNWVYAPAKAGAGLQEAALKVVGKESAMQCSPVECELDGYHVQALLPKPDAEASKIAGHGHFISVDSRPMSTSKGTLKQVVKMIKESLRKANARCAEVKDPFFCVGIGCPPGSYDPNVEPAKDDVLFDTDSKVLDAVRELLRIAYPPQPASCEVSNGVVETGGSIPNREGQEIAIPVHMDEEEPDVAKEADGQQPLRSNMYGMDEEDLGILDLATGVEETENAKEDEEQGLQSVQLFNPWTLAKMNASSKSRAALTPAPVDSPVVSTPRRSQFRPLAVTQGRMPAQAPTPQSSPVRPTAAAFPSNSPFSSSTVHAVSRYSPDIQIRHVPQPFQSRQQANHTGWAAINAPAQGMPLPGTPRLTPPVNHPRPRIPPRNSRKRPAVPTARDPERDNWFSHLPSPPKTQRRSRDSVPRYNAMAPLLSSRLSSPSPTAAFNGAETRVRRDRDIREFVGLSAQPSVDMSAPFQPSMRLESPVTPLTHVPNQTTGSQAASSRPPSSHHEAHPQEHPPTASPASPASSSRALPQLLRDLRATQLPATSATSTEPGSPPPTRRRRTTNGLLQTKSARASLEITPRRYRVQNLSLTMNTRGESLREIRAAAMRLDMAATLLERDWEADEAAYDGFTEAVSEGVLRAWAVRLRELLVKLRPGAEVVVGDVEGCLREVFHSSAGSECGQEIEKASQCDMLF